MMPLKQTSCRGCPLVGISHTLTPPLAAGPSPGPGGRVCIWVGAGDDTRVGSFPASVAVSLVPHLTPHSTGWLMTKGRREGVHPLTLSITG